MENIIEVKGLTKEFDGFTAVNGIHFSVKKGDIFAFLGPNGAGKTTTIKMLTTILEPTRGDILINGANPATDKDAVRRSFGIVFQDQSLDDELTAWENMEFHGVLYDVEKKLRRSRIESLLRLTELWERKDEQVKHFSGGMKRRLEIARGLLHHPKILFLDEPTIGLDPQTRRYTWDHIKALNASEGITVFFTTHQMEEAEKMATTVVVMDHGSIIATGSPEQICEKTGKTSLEEAFIALTGRAIRDEEASAQEKMRLHRRIHR